MKSFVDRPEGTSQFHSNCIRSCMPMWKMLCITRRRSLPSIGWAGTPTRLSSLSRLISSRSSFGLAFLMLPALMEKVRYLRFVRLLLPLASWLLSIAVYSSRISSNSSPCRGIITLRSKSSTLVAILIKENWKFTDGSNELRKLHHALTIASLSSSCACA